MNRLIRAGAFVVVAAVTGYAGFYVNQTRVTSAVDESAVQKLTTASFLDLGGKAQALSQWQGKVLVLNFWATWCLPCREEIPALINVQRQYAAKGVKVVGIAIDNVANVRDYATNIGIDYALLIGGVETLTMAQSLGNKTGVLPFTVVLDRSGRVAKSHIGILNEGSLGAILAPLLQG